MLINKWDFSNFFGLFYQYLIVWHDFLKHPLEQLLIPEGEVSLPIIKCYILLKTICYTFFGIVFLEFFEMFLLLYRYISTAILFLLSYK